jgi:chloramphenicol-sensitive protein RarD
LLVLTGVVTAAPLLLFASAARRIPLATVGLLQYVAPTLQLIIGVWVYDEAFDGGQLVGFGLIWIALLVFSTDVVRRHFGRRALAPVLQPAG